MVLTGSFPAKGRMSKQDAKATAEGIRQAGRARDGQGPFGGRLVSSLETMCHNGTLPSLRRVTSRKPKCSKLLLCTKTQGGHWSRVLGVLLGIKTLSTGSICFECGTWEKERPTTWTVGVHGTLLRVVL